MPGIRGIFVSLALIAMGVALASCSRSPCCNIEVVDNKDLTPAQRAIVHETIDVETTPQEIKRCFGNGIINTLGAQIYPLIKEKVGKKRYCHIAFSKHPKTGGMFLSVVRFDNYSEMGCRMRALKCLRPEAYKRIKEQYNIDEN